MVDTARHNEQVKPAQSTCPTEAVLRKIEARADAGGSMGVAILRTDSALYGLERLLLDPDCILVTRITIQGGAQKANMRKIGYDQLRAAGQDHTVKEFLDAAF